MFESVSGACQSKTASSATLSFIGFTIFSNKISPRVIQLAERVFEYLYETMVEIAKNFHKEGDKRIKHQKKKQVETFQELVEGFKTGEKVAMPLLLNNLSQSGATKEVNPEGHIVSINRERENTEEKEVFEQIKELTNEEYLERDYHYGSKGSTQSTMNFNIISHIFKEIHNDLNDKFKLFFFNGKVDLLQRIKILLQNELTKLESLYDFKSSLLEVTLKDGNKESIKNLRTKQYIFETKIEYIKQLIEKINSFTCTNTKSVQEEKEENTPDRQIHEIPEKNFASKKDESQTQKPLYTSKPPKNTSKHYALAFIYDCLAKGVNYMDYDGKKSQLEEIGKSRVNGAINGNTFYKAFNKIMNEKINLECDKDLIYLAGKNWKEIVLTLSDEPERLSTYLTSKGL